jgi:L-arabinokinase
VDKEATLEAYATYCRRLERWAQEEARWLKSQRISLVVADIPPVAFEAAYEAGIPGIGLTNFSWDWICEPYTEEFPAFRWVVDCLRRAYSRCTLLLQLPMAGDLRAFPLRKPIPFIVRKPDLPPTTVRKKLGIPENQKVILVALRPADLALVDTAALQQISNVLFITFDGQGRTGNLLSIANDAFRFPNLVAAADVVVSKPGYGIVSECLGNRKPLLFAARKDFAEYDVLARFLTEKKLGALIPPEDFRSGNWAPFLQKIFASPGPDWGAFNLSGATEAAREILTLLTRSGQK